MYRTMLIWTVLALLSVHTADLDASWDVRAPVLQLTVPAGGPASLICREPPPGNIGWYRKRGNSFPSLIKNTNRTTIDSDGTLHFSFVHGHDTGLFECGVSVTSSGSVVFGSTVNMTVKKSTGKGMDRKPKVMFHSGTIKSELGEDVQLECIFSGRPLPKISWTHSDKTIKSRGRVLVSHGFVVIKNVTEADRGVYTCTGENITGPESSSVTLDVSRTSSIPPNAKQSTPSDEQNDDSTAVPPNAKQSTPSDEQNDDSTAASAGGPVVTSVVVLIVLALIGTVVCYKIWRLKKQKTDNRTSTCQYDDGGVYVS